MNYYEYSLQLFFQPHSSPLTAESVLNPTVNHFHTPIISRRARLIRTPNFSHPSLPRLTHKRSSKMRCIMSLNLISHSISLSLLLLSKKPTPKPQSEDPSSQYPIPYAPRVYIPHLQRNPILPILQKGASRIRSNPVDDPNHPPNYSIYQRTSQSVSKKETFHIPSHFSGGKWVWD